VRRYGAWILFAALLGAWVAVSLLVLHQPFHVGARKLRYFDLLVYRGAASLILNGGHLYDARIYGGLPFTYPPFAALLFTPLAILPVSFDEVLVTAINIGALVAVLRLALGLHLQWSRREGAHRVRDLDPWPVVALAAAGAVWLEPITTTLGYGQIDLVIAALIVFDLARPDASRTKGAAIGLAAGLKLTPLLFVPYLLLSGRRRAAALATSVFAATVAIGFAVLPSDAGRYWGGAFLDPARVGRIGDSANQSLQGAIVRLTGSSSLGVAWLGLVAAVAALGLAGAVLASRRGDEATGFSLCAITALLASPISWTHHWALAVPVLFLLVLRAYERRSRAMMVFAAVAAAIGYAYIPEQLSNPHELNLTLGPLIAADPYVAIGLLAVGLSSAGMYRASRAPQATLAPT
jgi:alpha-1,2-mannosyltransferase